MMNSYHYNPKEIPSSWVYIPNTNQHDHIRMMSDLVKSFSEIIEKYGDKPVEILDGEVFLGSINYIDTDSSRNIYTLGYDFHIEPSYQNSH